MYPKSKYLFPCLALIALAAFSGQAFAATYAAVGSCVVPNAAAHTYTTIQSAVTNSPAGTTIEICPGIYPEQVTVTKRMTLEGVLSAGEDAAVIVPPLSGLVRNTTDLDAPVDVAAQILVMNTFATAVIISNLTVDGTGNLISDCSLDPEGILFQNSSGTVNHVATRNQIAGGTPSPCQTGEGIYVETGPGRSSKVTIENVSVHNYNKNGITGNDTGTKMTLSGNFVQGSGIVPCSASYQGAAQNGIQFGYGATGTIINSDVIDNVYAFDPNDASCPYTSSDILMVDTAENSAIKLQHNQLGNSNIPIGIFTFSPGSTGDGVSATGNFIFGVSTFDGVDVCTNGNTVTGNTIVNSSESAVHFDSSCGAGTNNVGTANVITESACAGILDDSNGTGGNSYGTETYWTVPFPTASSTASCPFVPPAGPAAQVSRARVNARPRVSPRR